MHKIRPEVKRFLSACEDLFEFAAQAGSLSPEECRALHYYAAELANELEPACAECDARSNAGPVLRVNTTSSRLDP